MLSGYNVLCATSRSALEHYSGVHCRGLCKPSSVICLWVLVRDVLNFIVFILGVFSSKLFRNPLVLRGPPQRLSHGMTVICFLMRFVLLKRCKFLLSSLWYIVFEMLLVEIVKGCCQLCFLLEFFPYLTGFPPSPIFYFLLKEEEVLSYLLISRNVQRNSRNFLS